VTPDLTITKACSTPFLKTTEVSREVVKEAARCSQVLITGRSARRKALTWHVSPSVILDAGTMIVPRFMTMTIVGANDIPATKSIPARV
jgi:hypothetical protein